MDENRNSKRQDPQVVTIIGRLAADPRSDHTQSGVKRTRFRVLCNRYNRDGGERDNVTGYNVTVFGRNAEFVEQYVHKGRLVQVVGSFDLSPWEGATGRHPTPVVTAYSVTPIGPRPGANNPGQSESPSVDISGDSSDDPLADFEYGDGEVPF
ncbi:MAG: single-stranded DNA-binding protein [Chloroflexia bacterium]